MEENKNNKLSAKFFFLTLGNIISLITIIITAINLLFSLLDRFIPDVLTDAYVYGYNSNLYTNLQTPLAILIIFFPIFFILAYYFRTHLNNSLNKKESGFLKWVIYFIIFLASLTIIIDLITLVHYFISGEITLRFIYKVVGVIILSSITLTYYISLLKDKKKNILVEVKDFNIRKILGLISFLIILSLIVITFIIMGSPKTQRQYRLDNLKVDNLQSIEANIDNYYTEKGALPAKLTDLEINYNPNIIYDPINKEIFKYVVVDKTNYKLCANFLTETPEKTELLSNKWHHGVGETCFDLKVSQINNKLSPQPLDE